MDAAKIDAITAEAKASEHTRFVSTNDILTSSFSNFIGARLSMMAINFRGKLPGLEDGDAGNYEVVVWYDKENFACPSAVRKRMQAGPPFTGLTRGFPCFFEGIFCKMGLITSWASFVEDLVLEGCEGELHLLLTSALGMVPYEVGVISRPKAGTLGVIYFTKQFDQAHFTSGKLPVGDPISKDIFE